MKQALDSHPAYFAPSSHSLDYDNALKLVMQRVAMVPDLVHLTKQWSACPDNDAVQRQAINLARRLYDFEDLVPVEQIMRKFSSTVDTKVQPLAPPIGQSWEFETLQVFWLVLSFFTYKAFVIGILLQILNLPGGNAMGLNHTSIEHEALSVLLCVAKCTQYASEFHSSLPIVEMRMIKPMIISWGVCDLLEQSLSVDCDGRGRAGLCDQISRMKKYFLHALKYINTRWHGKSSEMSEELLRRYKGALLEGNRYLATKPYVQAEFEW